LKARTLDMMVLVAVAMATGWLSVAVVGVEGDRRPECRGSG